jgi:mRNA interferase MazF
MVDAAWVPRRSEIIHLDDVGGSGHEQRGDRPHLVLTGQGYNDKCGLVVCVSVTTRMKGFPFEVPLSDLNKPSAALTHQVTTADWRARKAFSRGFANKEEMLEVEARLKALLGL